MSNPKETKAKVVVVFYSLYTHTYQLAQAIVAGAQSVTGVDVELYQVPEILPEAVIEKMGATKAKEAMSGVPVITHELQGEILKSADAVIFGSPTRFGSMTAQMKSFFDGLGGLWYENAFVGKLGSSFAGSGTQHGGQEQTLFSMITAMFHLGFQVVGLPYSCNAMKESKDLSGGTPYGSTHIAAMDGSRAVSENEKECAKFQGRHVAQLARYMRAGRAALGEAVDAAPTKTPTTAEKPAEKKATEETKPPKKKSVDSGKAETKGKEEKKGDGKKEPGKKEDGKKEGKKKKKADKPKKKV